MAWPRPVNSGQNQWYQWTYGIVPGGNWGPGHHLFVLDNGDVVSFVSHWTDFQYNETDIGASLVSIVRPDGCERILCDVSVSALSGNPYNYFYEPFVRPDWGGEGDMRENTLGTSWGELFGCTDGSDIFVFVADRNVLMKFDIQARRMTHMAGIVDDQTYVNDAYADSSVGVNGVVGVPMHCFYHDGYVYYWADGDTGHILRRISITAPYSLSTVRNYANPVGFTGSMATWGCESNADGYPNFMNADVMYPTSGFTPSAVYGDYLYVWSAYSGNPFSYEELARFDMVNWDKEVLYYGIDYSEPLHPIRDLTPNHRGNPNGVLVNSVENNRFPGTGTIHYEAMESGYNNAVIVNDYFITTNDQVSAWSSSDQVYGSMVQGVHLPTLLAAYGANGNKPIRHDRENPMWEMLGNATAGDEMFNFFNYRNRKRHFEHNDGFRPTCSHPLWQGAFATGNPGTPWDGKLLYHTSIIARCFIGDWDNNNAMAVKVLEPERSAGGLKARISFEGMALKGYSHVASLQKTVPGEMRLT